MRILSNKKYLELKCGYDLTNSYRIEKERNDVSHLEEILFYENRIEYIKNMLIDIVQNKKMAKDKMISKLNSILEYVYKGDKNDNK